MYNIEEFPQLKPANNIDQIEKITEQIISAVEQATHKIFETLNKKFQALVNKLGYDVEEEPEETTHLESNRNKNVGQISLQKESQETNNNLNETPANGTKRKYILPSIPSQKTKNLNTNQSYN